MNLVDCYVTEVLSKPYQKYGMWWVDVAYNSYGILSRTSVMCKTKEIAAQMIVGSKFLA